MNTGALILVAIFGFIATEGIVEYALGKPFEKIPKIQPFSWLLMYVSLGVGVFLAFHYKLDMIAIFSQYLKVPIEPDDIGFFITGCFIGRGAGGVHDLIDWIDAELKRRQLT